MYEKHNMEQLKRGDKIYLDDSKTKESAVNHYLDCRDGIVEVYEYRDESGYGFKNRLFLCEDAKHEESSIIRQIYVDSIKTWVEEELSFDTDSFIFLKALLNGKHDERGGEYTLVRHYSK